MRDKLNTNVTELNSWHQVDWETVNTSVKNLRQRIYVASREGDRFKVKNLQKLILRSRANWLQAIRRVTQINRGRRTPGVDREIVTTPEERLRLFKWLETITLNDWRPPAVQRVEIPKENGKRRPLGIPTVRDRVIQAIVKNALEPDWEARFEGSSYGFRPGRSAHDAIYDTWTALKGNQTGCRRQWIVDADIKGAFDNISHDFLLEATRYFPARPLIMKWLKAGVMVGLDLTPTEAGTPQGGIISPLLANIALHGMEDALGVQQNPNNSYKTTRRVIRYADDFVILTDTEEDAGKAKGQIQEWLEIRGLELSAEKTRIVHIEEGFDFLGFNIRRYKSASSRRGYAIHTRPSDKAIKRFKQKARDIFKKCLHCPPNTVIAQINPLIRGWGMYFRIGVSRQTFVNLDDYIWHRSFDAYARRRHPNKSKTWRKATYYTRNHRGWDWTFYDKETGTTIMWLRGIPIQRHIKVRGKASPDDPELTDYWEKRQGRSKELAREKKALWGKQRGLCPVCNDWLDGGEELHVHHLRGRGEERLKYKQLLHETCHAKVTFNGVA